MTLVNDTMMDHPMHLHGMFMMLDNGAGAKMPYKHTILVKAGEKLSFLVKPDEDGKFAFHCHLLLHMELGMFRVVSVAGPPATGAK
jgi:FtsP/CotA-like multicopper oxidase with cupredoxin domain